MRLKPLAYALFVSFVVPGFVVAGCGDKASTSPEAKGTTGGTTTGGSDPKGKPAEGTLAGLKIEDVTVGKGPAAQNGDSLWIIYSGKLADGTEFDSTAKHENQPYRVVVGSGAVIEGWDKGLIGIKKGGKRKLSIPWKMAYGERGSDTIPPKADLFFDVEAVAMIKQGEDDVLTVESNKVGSGPKVERGDKITFSYRITLPNKVEVDNQKKVTGVVGEDIEPVGMETALIGMQPGGKRTVSIPPRLGWYYGKEGVIPAQSVIVVDVEIHKVEKGKAKA